MRQREFIDKRQFDQLDRSIRFAAEIGRPLNTQITIQFGATSCDAENVGPAFRRLIRNYFTPWLRPTRGSPTDHRPAAWYYFVENVHEHAHHPHGTHVHWVAHVPPGLRPAFEAKLPYWVGRVAGMVHDTAVVIDVRDADRPRGTARYAGKALKPADAKRRGIRPIHQGVVFGRRLSISEAIHTSAINRHREMLRASAADGFAIVTTSEPGWPSNEDMSAVGVPWRA